MRSWFGRILALLIVGLIMLWLAMPDFVADRWERFVALLPYFGSDTARITVEIPAIHTRERLINDRNEQVAWIDEQLRKTTAQSLFWGSKRRRSRSSVGPTAAGRRRPTNQHRRPAAKAVKRQRTGSPLRR